MFRSNQLKLITSKVLKYLGLYLVKITGFVTGYISAAKLVFSDSLHQEWYILDYSQWKPLIQFELSNSIADTERLAYWKVGTSFPLIFHSISFMPMWCDEEHSEPREAFRSRKRLIINVIVLSVH